MCASFNFLIYCKKLKLIIFSCNIYLPCLIVLFILHVQYNCTQSTQKWSKTQHSVFYVHLYCTCNINKAIKQGESMSQKKKISLIFLHYVRKLKAAKI